MKTVFITYDKNGFDAKQMSALQIEGAEPITFFQNFPVASFLCRDQDLSKIERLKGVLCVHLAHGIEKEYRATLKRLDERIGIPIERREQSLSIVNMSLGTPEPYQFNENEPMNVATKSAAEAGCVVVVAVGNNGPRENTLNPWSVAPWVIGVGSANKEGTKLSEFSSVGIPDDPLYCPTVVALGEDIWTTTAPEGDERDHGTEVAGIILLTEEFRDSHKGKSNYKSVFGTSFAVPCVIRIIMYIFKFMEMLNHRQEQVLQLNPPSGQTTAFHWLRNNSIGIEIGFHVTKVKKILSAMARPISGCQRHQIGAGFVNKDLAINYLNNFSLKDLVGVFRKREEFPLDVLIVDKNFGPILPTNLIDDMVQGVDVGPKAHDCPII